MGRSILDDLGEEVTGIAAPVSICMILTITLVRLLNPDGDGDSGAVYLASIYYTEEVREVIIFFKVYIRTMENSLWPIVGWCRKGIQPARS